MNMIQSKTFGARLFRVLNLIILAVLAFSCFYPLWYTFCVSLSSKAAAEGGLVTLYPIGVNTDSYGLIMGDDAFWTSFFISVKRVVFGTVWTMIVIIMMAYPLSKTKRQYKPRNILMWILIFCMLFNGGTIPWFITVKNYGLIDTMAALVLSGSVPVFNVILLMNFFRNLPSDLEEAAVVDGAGPWTILWKIVVPCSMPVIATVILFTSVGYWNEYFQGLVLMNKESNYPLQTYIRQITVQIPVGVTLTTEQYQALAAHSNKSLEAAKVFIALIPMLIIYPFLQKYFVTGITLGAVKE
ncbi:MAG: carbohydrate ABC transporter permease [Butyrivibrio sp.]|jgi:multiple sugar transport system permease protein/putative aldouronate transport system permease protein|nr:carbohydrate ABC transporter permease [Butyrivibrio sp.]